LEENDESRGAALHRLASWYLLTAGAAIRATYPRLADPPEFTTDASVRAVRFDSASDALEWFHVERANLLAVCRAAHAAGLDEIAVKLPDTLFLIYESTSTVDDLREAAQIGLQAARRHGDRSAQARGQRVLGFAHKIAGDLAQAAACQRSALALFEQIESSDETMITANALGLVELDRRELPEAVRLFEKTLALATDSSAEMWRAIAIDNLAAAHKEAGRYELALDLATQALEAYRDVQAEPQVSVVPLLHLGRIHRETGDLIQAEVYMDKAKRVLADVTFVSAECNLLLERAALHFALGHDDEAMETYWQALQMQRPLGDRNREATVYTGLGRILVRLGRCQEALDFHEQAISIRRKNPDAFLHAEALSYLAEALRALGQVPRAGAVRREAVTLLSDLEDPRADMLRQNLESA
jgi:tetratricopeptide (TPR) repeat protein